MNMPIDMVDHPDLIEVFEFYNANHRSKKEKEAIIKNLFKQMKEAFRKVCTMERGKLILKQTDRVIGGDQHINRERLRDIVEWHRCLDKIIKKEEDPKNKSILELKKERLTQKEIAEKLGLSLKTVNRRIKKLLKEFKK